MESNTLHRGRLIDHILLVVEDFEASKNFYTAVLSALEIPVITTANEYLLADELVVASRHSPEAAGKLTGRHHLAFQARDRDMVDAFYHAALTHCGRDNGAPGERHYHPGYYAAFVLDPQGIILRRSTMARLSAAPGLLRSASRSKRAKSHFLTCAIPIINVGVIISLMNNSYP